MNNINVKYVVPVGSRITRRFYCPILKKEISLTEDFTENEIIFNSNHLTKVDSGVNFSYFRFTVSNTNGYPVKKIIKNVDVCYSVSAEYIEIKKEVINN